MYTYRCPFFVNQQKICFNRHRTLNTLVGIDQVLDTFGEKKCWEKKQNALTALFSSRRYSIYIFFCFISLSNLFEKQKQVLLSL